MTGERTATEVQASALSVYAHSANAEGHRQELVDHLRGVARLARVMGEPFGAGELAYLSGLWHDAGKADPAWQRRLDEVEAAAGEGGPIGIDHKCAGAIIAEGVGGVAALACGLLIQGHHGGLRSPQEFKDWLDRKRQLPGPAKALEAVRSAMPGIADHAAPEFPAGVEKDVLSSEFFLRLAFSALVDADSLDTEAHKLGRHSPRRPAAPPAGELWDMYLDYVGRQPPPDPSGVNAVRREVHDACVAAAEGPQGVYRLAVPTGGGKTRSGLAFALRHCAAHGLRRVVVAVPFTSITQQTAAVYRDIFGAGPTVLEHHSAAHPADREGEEDGFAADAVWERLAAENWDAPIVVTTTVQLFDSLFSNRRGRTRKLHNLARSVIILDEAQALPIRLLAPILSSLRQLVDLAGCTVVLSTATQPAFDLIPEFAAAGAREIVPGHADHFRRLRRVRYEWRADRANRWEEIAGLMAGEQQALAIVNTKRHARELLDALQQQVGAGGGNGGGGVAHLSTLLCGAHRTAALNEIRRRLGAGDACRVVSTQVVEAGVDLDFPVVLRAEAPLDSVIQAAGRCNREGLLGPEGGRVVVFRPPDDAGPGGHYRTGTDLARVVRAVAGHDPDDPETARRYYQLLLETADTDAEGIQKLRGKLDYPAVADKFRMIDSGACDVLVDYPDIETADRIAAMLAGRRVPAREALNEAQPHTVSLHRREYERLVAAGMIEPIRPYRDLGRWAGAYDPVGGLSEADPNMVF